MSLTDFFQQLRLIFFVCLFVSPLLLELFHPLSHVVLADARMEDRSREVRYQPNLIFPSSFSSSDFFSFTHLLLSQIYEGPTTNDSKERF